MHQQVYHSHDIQAWEQRWFAQQNSSYGLMQQVAWSITQQLIPLFKTKNIFKIAVCCGQGNNAGDGYLVAKYLKQFDFEVDVYCAELGASQDLRLAYEEAKASQINMIQGFHFIKDYDCVVDALFGIGLNRELNENWQLIINEINEHQALKISIDIPSGLNANTGRIMPCAILADYTYTVLALKIGLFTGQAKEYVGNVEVISPIPTDSQLKPNASLTPQQIRLKKRKAFGHKGSYGHVLVVGGHADMGGAAIMAAEAAFASGSGKVTVACDQRHHAAILARSPNIMLKDINYLSKADVSALVESVDAICFGMGLGRDNWSKNIFDLWFEILQNSNKHIVLDADALWFLAENPININKYTYLTPHPGEAAKLLSLSTMDIEHNRFDAIEKLKQKYAGEWVLKGSGSLIFDKSIWICTAGNAGMATGGMGDVLAGMIASLKAQFQNEIQLHEIVTLHALAGDLLAEKGLRGLQAQDMSKAIYQIVNL